MKFHEKLRRRVLELGLNKARAARDAGLPESTISAYLSKRASLPRIDISLRIARALRVPLEWLADDQAGWPPPPTSSAGALTTAELTAELGRRFAPVGVIALAKIAEAERVDWVATATALLTSDVHQPLPKTLHRRAELPSQINGLAREIDPFEPATELDDSIAPDLLKALEVVPGYSLSLEEVWRRHARLDSMPGYSAVLQLSSLWLIPNEHRPPWFEEVVKHTRARAQYELDKHAARYAAGAKVEGDFRKRFPEPQLSFQEFPPPARLRERPDSKSKSTRKKPAK